MEQAREVPSAGEGLVRRERLATFLFDHPAGADDTVVHWLDGSMTLTEMQQAARRVAAALAASGVEAGQPVACLVDSGASALAVVFGTWLIDAVHVPVNSRLTDRELEAQLAAIRPAAVVGRRVRTVRHAARWVAEDAPLHWSPAASCVTWFGERMAPGAALVMRTSGTTGDAKSIVLTHDGVRDGIDTVLGSLRSQRSAAQRPVPARMPNLVPTSLALWAGLWNALFALRAGAPVVLLDRFSTVDFAALVKRHAVRSTVLAPAMMSMLVDDPRVQDLSPLTRVRSITAPLTPHQARAFKAKFGVGVMNCYGQTELGSEVVGWTPADLRRHGEVKLGAVGRAHDGVELRILDDTGEQVPLGETGEIAIRSPFASTSAEVSARLVDGFLRTGDLGRLDEDGFLWLEGRVSDMVNRGGLKVLPQEVEDVLRALPGVADACVAGVPDDRLGEVPMAWVRPTAGAHVDPSALLSEARSALAGYKVPVGVEVVDDFPRNEIGKVLRRSLVREWSRRQASTTTTRAVR